MIGNSTTKRVLTFGSANFCAKGATMVQRKCGVKMKMRVLGAMEDGITFARKMVLYRLRRSKDSQDEVWEAMWKEKGCSDVLWKEMLDDL